MIFQGIWTSIAKKPYIFIIFQGGGGAHPPLDPHMDGIPAGFSMLILQKFIRCLFSQFAKKSEPEVIKLGPCSIQLSMKLQLLIKTKMRKNANEDFSCFQTLRWCIYQSYINIKMLTITVVGILIFMSMINFMFS